MWHKTLFEASAYRCEKERSVPLKYGKMHFWPGLCPGPHRGSSQCSLRRISQLGRGHLSSYPPLHLIIPPLTYFRGYCAPPNIFDYNCACIKNDRVSSDTVWSFHLYSDAVHLIIEYYLIMAQVEHSRETAANSKRYKVVVPWSCVSQHRSQWADLTQVCTYHFHTPQFWWLAWSICIRITPITRDADNK